MAYVEIVTTSERWQIVKDQWDALVADARASIYQTSAWLCNWWDYYGQGVGPEGGIIDFYGQAVGPIKVRLAVCLVWDQDTLIGAAPFYLHRKFHWQVEVARCLRVIGGYHTDLVALPGKETLVGELIAEEILHERLADTMVLWEVPTNSPTASAFVATLRRRDASVREHAGEDRCTTVIPPSFEQFFEGLSRNRRNEHRHAAEAVERLGVTIETSSSSGGSLDAEMRAFFDLHCNRWRAAGIVSPYSDEGRRRHMLNVARAFRERGWLHLVSLVHKGHIAETNLQFYWPHTGTAYRHQDARDLEWTAFAPGKFLLTTTFSHMLRAGLTRCDHGRGKEEYKTYYKPIVVDRTHSVEVIPPPQYARPIGVALNGLRSVRAKAQSLRLRRAERAFDRAHGVTTEEYSEPADLHGAESCNPYEGTSAQAFRAIFARVRIPYGDFSFVDLGSGKGRVVLMASELPFQKIIGVEVSAELHRVAQDNVMKFRTADQRCRNIQLLCSNVSEFQIPAGKTVFYLFNPFQKPVLETVLANIGRSLEERPRDIFIVYYNDKYELTDLAPFLEKVDSGAARYVPPGYERVEQRPFAIFRNKAKQPTDVGASQPVLALS